MFNSVCLLIILGPFSQNNINVDILILITKMFKSSKAPFCYHLSYKPIFVDLLSLVHRLK